jgi:GAF domain-containing protein
MPIVNKGETVGVLQAMNKMGGPYDARDEKLAKSFCAQAAVAINNSNLFQMTERALNQVCDV